MKTIPEFIQKKQAGKKISVITCYDYTSAAIVEKTAVDCALVGDSGVMTMHGAENTTHATMEHMIMYTQAVAKGIRSKPIIADMPFLSYRKSLSKTMTAVGALIQAGAHAIKLEGCEGNLAIIEHIVNSGVPVMGHLGLTPQHILALGGYKLQATTTAAHQLLLQQAKQLEAQGCFAIVLECIPMQLAKTITQTLKIPTIGIGAGGDTDGQVLVFQDLLGLQTDFNPKFVKKFLNGAELFQQSINQYVKEINDGNFPTAEFAYE